MFVQHSESARKCVAALCSLRALGAVAARHAEAVLRGVEHADAAVVVAALCATVTTTTPDALARGRVPAAGLDALSARGLAAIEARLAHDCWLVRCAALEVPSPRRESPRREDPPTGVTRCHDFWLVRTRERLVERRGRGLAASRAHRSSCFGCGFLRQRVAASSGDRIERRPRRRDDPQNELAHVLVTFGARGAVRCGGRGGGCGVRRALRRWT